MWDLIVSVPDHCLSCYFVYIDCVGGASKVGVYIDCVGRAYKVGQTVKTNFEYKMTNIERFA